MNKQKFFLRVSCLCHKEEDGVNLLSRDNSFIAGRGYWEWSTDMKKQT